MELYFWHGGVGYLLFSCTIKTLKLNIESLTRVILESLIKHSETSNPHCKSSKPNNHKQTQVTISFRLRGFMELQCSDRLNDGYKSSKNLSVLVAAVRIFPLGAVLGAGAENVLGRWLFFWPVALSRIGHQRAHRTLLNKNWCSILDWLF